MTSTFPAVTDRTETTVRMMASIGFEELRFSCLIGCCPEERIFERPLLVDLSVTADISRAAASDSLADTINQVRLMELCVEVGQKGQFHLLEAYANAVLDQILVEFAAVESVKIRVKKPQEIPSVKWTTLEMERKR
jgi:dihydroneopterin aldolase